MKKCIARVTTTLLLLGVLLLPAAAQQRPAYAKATPRTTQTKYAKEARQAEGRGAMAWTSKSREAKDLVSKGLFHMMNVEMPQAYDYFAQALEKDPNFTLPLVMMADLSAGEAKKAYMTQALESGAHKPEGEKLLASLSDEKSTEESRRETWSKLHELYPEDVIIATGFVQSRTNPDERFAAAQEFLKKFPDKPWIYNDLGYYYLLTKKDYETAKKNFEKYIELYPDGYNPYDSMGEYYLTIGDLDNAEKYYTKTLEIYPFANSAITALQKIKEQKEKKTTPNEDMKP